MASQPKRRVVTTTLDTGRSRHIFSDLDEAIERILTELPKPPGRPEKPLWLWAVTIRNGIWTTRVQWHPGRGADVEYERPAEAIKSLKRLRMAAQKMGPLADEARWRASLQLRAWVYAESVGYEPFELIAQIDKAIELLRPHVSTAKSPPLAERQVARACARAYTDITGRRPPTTGYVTTSEERPYNRLVREIFELFRLPKWQRHARDAAERIARKSRKK